MTDSMNFGPDWIRNLSSEGSTTGSGGGGPRYHLADYRYGREEMLALYDKNLKPPSSLVGFKPLYSETTLLPLALMPNTDEEQRGFQRPASQIGPSRSRGGLLERGGRVNRGGRGNYPSYTRPIPNYESGGSWGNSTETTEWSPRKDSYGREGGMRGLSDNWRRNRGTSDEEDGWRNLNHLRSGGNHEKWGRSISWRGGDGEMEDRQAPPERIRGWNDRGSSNRRGWETEDHLPEWATENPMDGGGTFDSSGAFHGSDDEQLDYKGRKESLIQKSSSQHNMSEKRLFNSLQTSKSAVNIQKSDVGNKVMEIINDMDKQTVDSKEKHDKSKDKRRESVRESPVSSPPKTESRHNAVNGQLIDLSEGSIGKADEDFKIQEVILKLVDEDTPKPKPSSTVNSTSTETPQLQPPPNLAPPLNQEQWFYQDPQGQMQGPFSSTEMADWYKAGYFTNQLKVRRPCDDIFYMLGDLVAMGDGQNPFLMSVRFPPLKGEPAATAPIPDEMLQYQYLMALRETQQARTGLAEPWSSLNLPPQSDVAAQRLMMHPQISQDLPFIHQSNPSNSLMHLLSQMQANKMATPSVNDKAPPNIPNSLDPMIQLQLNNLHQMQNRIPSTAGLPTNPLASRLPTAVQSDGLAIPGMLGAHPLTLGPSLTPSISNPLNMPRPPQQTIENLVPKSENDPLSNLLKQLQQQKQQQNLESFWQQSQYSMPSSLQNPQWQQNQSPAPFWDMKPNQSEISSTLPDSLRSIISDGSTLEKLVEIAKEKKEDTQSAKEAKKKKEQEEKQAKKEAEEKRKQEQKKLEVERKAAEEKKKKEEERIKKELEKAKKEAEEKRLRELEEKRRLKEQRKAEEEAKKKLEEQKKLEEERIRKEMKEREEMAKKEALRQAQEQALKNAKAAPWSQSNSTQGLSLSEIQKLEKERKAQELVLQQKQMQEMQMLQQQMQQNQEKSGPGYLSWAKKPMEPRKVQSLAEIQAEEQEKLAKQQAEARLLALQKEKEAPPVQNVGNIWNSQNLSWSSTTSSSNAQSQWNTNSFGLWEETTVVKSTTNKPSQVQKAPAIQQVNKSAQPTQQQPAQKPKAKKKEDSSASKTSTDEFSNWCFKTLSNITSEVDIPTFVTFLRDIESAFDIREYCKEYLGDNSQTHQFASQFLEKRRQFKPKSQVPKDDMCSPAPAITPSLHSSDFQEVKGKNKKNKKNKMLKVDSRILGFNVTSAPDRINVGDRDYGDNS